MTRNQLCLLIFFSLIGFPGRSADVRPALPVQVSAESEIGEKLREQLPEILRSALSVVQMFTPNGYENNLFAWSKNRQILTGKSVSIIFATSKTPSIAPLLANSGSTNLDAFTLVPIDKTKNTMSILLVLLVDKIFFDAEGRQHPYGHAKLILALAHEIYGNVQHFLEFNMTEAKPQTMEDRVNQEREAFHASLMFLAKVRDSEEFSSLPESVGRGLMSLLPSEIRAFKTWQQAHPSKSKDPACEAMLNSTTKNS